MAKVKPSAIKRQTKEESMTGTPFDEPNCFNPEEKINIDFLKSQLKEKQEIIEEQFKEIQRLQNELHAYKLVNLAYIDKFNKISVIILDVPSYEEVEKLSQENIK